jgi:hypothetical protein
LKYPWLVNALALVAVAANIIGIFQLGFKSVWSYGLLAGIVLVAALAPLSHRLTAAWVLRNLLRRAEGTLRTHGVRPDIVLAFDRSSAIHAGMLCQRLSIGRLLVLPSEVDTSITVGPRKVLIGNGMALTFPTTPGRPLVLVFHLRTGTTLSAALDYMEGIGLDPALTSVLALHATPGARAVWPSVMVVRDLDKGEIPNQRFPWLDGDYDRR